MRPSHRDPEQSKTRWVVVVRQHQPKFGCPGPSMVHAEQFDEVCQQSTRLSEFQIDKRLWPTHSPKDSIGWRTSSNNSLAQGNITFLQSLHYQICNNMCRVYVVVGLMGDRSLKTTRNDQRFVGGRYIRLRVQLAKRRHIRQ